MSVFISKLQHDTFEKGEFSEEKSRTLAETLVLIQEFPWDSERNLTDIQLTGPSVTIQNDLGDFLKVGLYFNGKYCIYYLRGDAVYEYPVIDLESIGIEVDAFYNDLLNLDKYHHDLFKLSARSHFETNNFEYRIKTWKAITLNFFLLIYAIVLSIYVVAMFTKYHQDIRLILVTSVFLLFAVFFWTIIGKTIYTAIAGRNTYLKISRGNDLFLYGLRANAIKSYSKTDIEKIIRYVPKGRKNPILIEVYEVVFKDGSFIKLSNMLISGITFLSKFLDNRGRLKVQIVEGKSVIKKI